MARQTKALVQEAEALGIDVDGRWGDETLQEKIDEAKVACTAAEEAGDHAEGEDTGASEPGSLADKASDGDGHADGDGNGTGDEEPGSPKRAGDGAAGGAEGDPIVLPLTGSGDTVVVAEGPATAAALKIQIEALTDGEGDAATSGEAGDGEAGAPDLPAGGDGGDAGADRLSERASEGLSAGGGDQGEASSDAGAPGADVPAPVAPASGDGDPARSGDATMVNGDGGADVLGDAEEDATPDHGDGSADGTDDELERQIASAKDALTRPIVAAYQAAGVVFGALSMEGGERWQGSFNADWFGREHMSEHPVALVHHAAPFVRTWPDAPAEALYGHVRSGGGVNLVLDRAWSDLPLAERLAWRTFRDVLVAIDAGVKAEWKAETPERVAREIPIDETSLEETEDPLAPAEIAGGAR